MGLAPLNGRSVGAIFFWAGHILCCSRHLFEMSWVSCWLHVCWLDGTVLAGFPCASWFPAPAGSYQPNSLSDTSN